MDDLRIPCVLWLPGHPPPDLSGFAEPIRLPVRVVWRKIAAAEQSAPNEPPPLVPAVEIRGFLGFAPPECTSDENHRRDMSHISEIRPKAAKGAQETGSWDDEYALGASIYAYIGNDPINNIDPSGLLVNQVGIAALSLLQNLNPISTAAAASADNFQGLKIAAVATRAGGLRTPEELEIFHDAITGQTTEI